MTELEFRYREVQKKITHAAGQRSVNLIAVSKGQPIESVEELYRLGHRDFGENYAQEMAQKAELLSTRGFKEVRWHFLGHLQTNKVKSLISWIDTLHSLDSERLAQELAKRSLEQGVYQRKGALPVFLEVNISSEASKSGVSPEEVPRLASRLSCYPEVNLIGLMTVPDPASNVNESFRKVAEMSKLLGLKQLSMGMSSDFETAIAEGATHIRVGTAIFGPRK